MQLYVKATQGERHRHKEGDRGEGPTMMTLTRSEGQRAQDVEDPVLLTVANTKRMRYHNVVSPSKMDGGGDKGFYEDPKSINKCK